MLDKPQNTETSEERTAPERQPETILKKLRYPNKSLYGVKYKDGEYVITSEDDR